MKFQIEISVQFSSITQSCPTLCDPMNRNMPGLPVHHQHLELAQTHVHWVSDAIQPSHPLSSLSLPAFNLSQHQFFPMSQFFASGGYSTGTSASASVLSVNIQDWFPIGWTGWICFKSKGLLRTPWTIARQASLSITNSWSPPKPMSIESVMPSNHLILSRPLLLLPSIFPSIRVFSNELVHQIRWPKYWSFSFNISPSNEHPGLISFMMDWLDFLACLIWVQLRKLNVS